MEKFRTNGFMVGINDEQLSNLKPGQAMLRVDESGSVFVKVGETEEPPTGSSEFTDEQIAAVVDYESALSATPGAQILTSLPDGTVLFSDPNTNFGWSNKMEQACINVGSSPDCQFPTVYDAINSGTLVKGVNGVYVRVVTNVTETNKITTFGSGVMTLNVFIDADMQWMINAGMDTTVNMNVIGQRNYYSPRVNVHRPFFSFGNNGQLVKLNGNLTCIGVWIKGGGYLQQSAKALFGTMSFYGCIMDGTFEQFQAPWLYLQDCYNYSVPSLGQITGGATFVNCEGGALSHPTGITLQKETRGNSFASLSNVTIPAGNFSNLVNGITTPAP